MSILKKVAKAAVVRAIDKKLASKQRSRNIPIGAEVMKSQQYARAETPEETDWRVRVSFNEKSLIDDATEGVISDLFRAANNNRSEVVFPYQPEMTIATVANYTGIDPVHSNYTIQTYKGSQVSDITISGVFTAETEEEARYWIAATTFFKAATKMAFGQSNNAGSPPIICRLNGYGPGIIPADGLPIVIKNFSVTLPQDVNYVKCTPTTQQGTQNKAQTEPTWVPIESTISITVAPIYSREKIRQFNLQDYANGTLGKGFM